MELSGLHARLCHAFLVYSYFMCYECLLLTVAHNGSSSVSSWRHASTDLTDDHGDCATSPTLMTAAPRTSSSSSSSWASSAGKLLKCPCCNWSYKYRETLEIHMREKHCSSDDDTALVDTLHDVAAAAAAAEPATSRCAYCTGGAGPHPRLARGETYPCGYKPYRCDVCQYSTTTKGNLSIHMQSDRHVNNVQVITHTHTHTPLLTLCGDIMTT